MQTLICIETPEWELTISSQHLDARKSTYSNMLNQRGSEHIPNYLQFKPAISPEKIMLIGQDSSSFDSPLLEVELPKPLFFENAQYQFEWVFLQDNIENAFVAHPLISISGAFRFTAKRKHSAASLIGTINTGNDIGQLSLPLAYKIDGKIRKSNLTLEVLPTKMQLHNDLPAMYKCIDETFPLWRFNLAGKTEQNATKSQNRGNFPLLWLAQFKALREEFELGLKVIANSPHNRLQSKTFDIKAERLKGKLSNRLAEQVKEDIDNKIYDRRYKQKKKYLSVDTVENRYIKMVVTQCKRQLEIIYNQLKNHKKDNDKQYSRLSEHFLSELKMWQQPLLKMERRSFLKEVGKYTGLQRESLVLQQKTGYSTVYKTWQELKYYLDIFAKHSSVSMKSVAETYEVWCFLEVRKILIDVLGFNEKDQKKSKLKLNDYFELQLEDGLTGAGSFKFERVDGLKAKLAHEPLFKKDGKNIRSFWVTQKPDILLEVTFPDGRKCIWLFDAKYRIKTKNNRYDSDDVDHNDFVPDDAINQMHRYRDALIQVNGKNTLPSKSRPVFGAFALYPGFYDQNNAVNPYDSIISEVGIGAFALLPSDKTNENVWLENFLIQQLGRLSSSYSANYYSDGLYINDAARIPYSGMTQVLHQDLTLISKLGNNRTQSYVQNFKNGSAKWFHIPVSVFNAKFGEHIAQELSYLAIIDNTTSTLDITKAYSIKSVLQCNRDDISDEQSGVDTSEVQEDQYWLFELGETITLKQSINCDAVNGFRESLKLATLEDLQVANCFVDISPVYERSIS
jgi:hypothetical protein